VYAGNKKDADDKLAPYTESDPVAPLNVYGQTKAGGEQAIRESGCRHLIFRTSWVYSPYGKTFTDDAETGGRARTAEHC
jgi:dTDP-4-dehydrorhamnose reductase